MEQSLREDVTAREILYLLSIQLCSRRKWYWTGLVENQPNTSIKREEKKNQEKEPKQKEVGEEMLRTDLREMEQG